MSAGDPVEPSADLVDAVRRFLDHLAVEKGRSANTLAAYRRDLARYLRRLAAAGVTAPDQVTTGHVTGFLQALSTGEDGGAPLAVRSAARVLRARSRRTRARRARSRALRCRPSCRASPALPAHGTSRSSSVLRAAFADHDSFRSCREVATSS